MLFLQYQILKAQERINHDECYHVKQFILASFIFTFIRTKLEFGHISMDY